MQNPIQKFRQSSIVFEKPGILSENLTRLNYPRVQYFLLKLRTRILLTNVYKRVWGIFFVSFKSWIICKNLKRPGFYTLIFYTFINNSISKQNKKNPTNPFVDITKHKTCAKFQHKILNSMVVGTRQSFQLSTNKTWFLGNDEGLPFFRFRLYITWFVLPNYEKIST